MTVRGRWWAAGAALGAVVFVLGGFLVRAGLQRADQWASVFGLFLNVAGVVTAAIGVRQARRAAAPAGAVVNTVDGGEFGGSVTMGRDAGGSAGPGAQAGDVTNRIGGGRFHGPVRMGRDSTDPPGTPGR